MALDPPTEHALDYARGPARGAADLPEDLPSLEADASGLPEEGLHSPAPNRLAALRAELPLAASLLPQPAEDDDDVAELDDFFIQGEP